jgi:hypothetical protein
MLENLLFSPMAYYLFVSGLFLYSSYPLIKNGVFYRNSEYFDDELLRETFLVSSSQTIGVFVFYLIFVVSLPPLENSYIVLSSTEQFLNSLPTYLIFLGLFVFFRLFLKNPPWDILSKHSSRKYKVNYFSMFLWWIFCLYSIHHYLDSVVDMSSVDVGFYVLKVVMFPLAVLGLMSYQWTYCDLTHIPAEEKAS